MNATTTTEPCMAGISDGLCAVHDCPQAEAEIKRLRAENEELRRSLKAAQGSWGAEQETNPKALRWCDGCDMYTDSEEWRRIRKDGVFVQLCHRHNQES